ncbi:MAG: discoidin domain-containing protein [Gammaproteobacteria bacterium]
MTTNNRRSRALVLSFAAFAAVAVPAPLYAQGQNCPAGAPAQDPNVPQELQAFNSGMNQLWPGAVAAAQKIDPLTNLPLFQEVSACGSDGDTVCGLNFASCEHRTVNIQLDQITGLSQLSASSFSNMTVQGFNPKEIAQHTAKGPDASKITDGVFAEEGTSWNDPSYTVVLTSGVSSSQFQNALLQSALTIDLGSLIQICTSSQCGGATVQADRHSFALEYSTDGTTWLSYGTVPYKDSDGLHTRSVTIASSFDSQPVTAQYVRVYGRDDKDGNNDYAISEVELKDSEGKIISINKLAIGPRPYQITDGVGAPEGHTWNDPTYAAVLRSVGVANALVIDLGGLVNVCGSTTCGPTVQADRHPFQFDYSPDGINWVPWSQVPEVSGSGLITRTSSQIAANRVNPNLQSFTARFVRLYGLPADDDNYSISEVTLRNTASGNPVVSQGKLTYGPEPLETDGQVAPESADWNDPRYANILAPCGQSTSTVCAQGSQTGLTGALLIDLGQVFGLEAIQVQADRHQFQIDYRASPTDPWQPLWTVPSVSGSGLLTRPSCQTPPCPPQKLAGQQARYLMVYGTAGDDSNYSVSSVKVYTPIAKTACAYASFADAAQQAAACSYDGTMTTDIIAPGGALPTSFTIVKAEAHYQCCCDITGSSFPVSVADFPDNTSCTGNLQLPQEASGQFCSATCVGGATPDSALTFAGVNTDFTLTDLKCNHSSEGPGATQLKEGVEALAAGTAAAAVEQLFVEVAVSPSTTPSGQKPPLIPSGQCQPPSSPSANTQLSGRATHVGKASEGGQVSLRGAVSAPDAPPLHTLTLALDRVLHEHGGVEELVRTAGAGLPAVPLTLLPQKGSNANRALYATAPGVKPSFRAEVRNAPGGQLEFSLDVRGAHMPTLPTCTEGPSPSVLLGTGFSLGTDGGPRIDVHALQDWQCEGKHRLATP